MGRDDSLIRHSDDFYIINLNYNRKKKRIHKTVFFLVICCIVNHLEKKNAGNFANVELEAKMNCNASVHFKPS